VFFQLTGKTSDQLGSGCVRSAVKHYEHCIKVPEKVKQMHEKS